MIPRPDWKELPAKNFGTRGPGVFPKFIVLHDTANVGTHAETLYLASKNGRGVSACFTVERDGGLWKLNPDLWEHYTFHAGRNTKSHGFVNGEVNRNSIGIEICQTQKVEPYPDVQIDAVARLCAWIVDQFDLDSAKDITTHAKIITDSSRSDPRQFPFDGPSGFWTILGRYLANGRMVRPTAQARDVSVRLGGIAAMVRQAPKLRPALAGLEAMCPLTGALYFESDLDLDTDGEEEAGITYEPTHQRGLSIGGGVNSNRVPYVVLPVGFAAEHGLRLGDVAAVLYRDKIEFAVYADNGPRQKIGEGSIALHRALGFERVKDGRIVDVGIGRGVVTILFRGSGNGRAQTPDKIRDIGRERFRALGGVL